MDNEIQYPTDHMSAVAAELRSFVEAQWGHHDALFRTNQDSLRELLTAFASVIPNAGARATELGMALDAHHQQLQSAYASLIDLADQIDRAAEAMRITDRSLGGSFDSPGE